MPSHKDNPFVEDLSKAGGDALKIIRALKDVALDMHRHMLQSALDDMDAVSRDEFEAARDMALEALRGHEKLARRVAALEARLGIVAPAKPAKPVQRKTKRTAPARRKARSKKA